MNRRSFLLGTSALAISSPAFAARLRRGGGSNSSSFNGGRSQVNFNFLQSGGEFPFINVCKTSQSFAGVDTNTPPDPSVVLYDSDGYPTVVPTDGIYTVCFCPTQLERSGDYIMTWNGNGTVIVPASVNTGSATSTTGSGSCTFTPPSNGRLVWGIQSIGSPHITNIQIYHNQDASLVAAGKTFGTQFKNRLGQANFGVYRFLNWQLGNTSNVSQWSQRKPTTFAFYYGSEFRTSYYGGTTTKGAADDYTLSAPSNFSGLVDKATVICQFDQTATAVSSTVTISIASPAVVSWTAHGLSANAPVGFNNSGGALPPPLSNGGNFYVSATGLTANSFQVSLTPGGASINTTGSTQSGTQFAIRQTTVNIGSTGVIPVKDSGGSSFVTGNNSNPRADRFGAFTYDAVLGSWLLYGGQPADGDRGLESGCPPEVCFQLCLEMGAHPYFVSPRFVTDPISDYMPNLMLYCKSNAPSWMLLRYEGINEEWNDQFYGNEFATNKAFAYWGVLGDNDFQGKTISCLGQAAAGVYGSGLGTKYQVLCGVQTVSGSSPTQDDHRVTAASYVAQSAAAQGALTGPWGTITFSKSSAAAYITHICFAQYMVPSDFNQPAEATLAAAFNGCSLFGSVAAGSTTLVVASVNAGAVAVGALSGPNLSPGTTIVSGSGTTWTLNQPSIYGTGNSNPMVLIPSTSDSTAPGTYADTLNSGSGSQNLASLATYNTNFAAWAAGFGLGICGYEGGYSPDYTSQGESQADLLKSASKQVSQIQTYLSTNYQNFANAGGIFPACFQLGGSNPSSDAWAILEDIYQTTSPQLLEIIAFNH